MLPYRALALLQRGSERIDLGGAEPGIQQPATVRFGEPVIECDSGADRRSGQLVLGTAS